MKSAWLIVVVSLCACGKSKEQQEQEKKLEKLEKLTNELDKQVAADKARKPTGTPRPQPDLHVTVDGKPVEMVTALAWKDRYGDIRITASSVPVGCAEVTGEMRSLYDNEVTFDVTMGMKLQPDGSVKPVVQSTYFEGMTNQTTTAPVAGGGDAAPGQPTRLGVDFKTESAAEPKHVLEVKGMLDAIGCAVPPLASPPPALPPEMPATIEIAGKKLAVRGASLSTVGDWPQLVLTTGGDACSGNAATGEMRVELTWFDKAKPAVSQVSLGGSLLPAAIDQTYDKKKITVTPAPPTAPGDVTLEANIQVNGYPVKLAGKVTAVVCPK